ncbi:MAG: hypothetical protein JXQ93_02195 [Flavobacteriaceae bacterium]
MTIEFCFAQKVEFAGRLVDKVTREPISYASIYMKNRNIGITTRENGYFRIMIEKDLLKEKVMLSCLNYRDTILIAAELNNKTTTLTSKRILLPEISLNKGLKKLTLGSSKGVIKESILSPKKGVLLYAQFIKNPRKNKDCVYINVLTVSFGKRYSGQKIRIRFFNKNKKNGSPYEDLLFKSLILELNKNQSKYILDLSDYDLLMPESGIFVVFEKLFLPENNLFKADKERSNYPTYLSQYKSKKDSLGLFYKDDSMDFLTYSEEEAYYGPGIAFTKRKFRHKDLGEILFFMGGKWVKPQWLNKNEKFVFPLKIGLTD